uniref:E3 ubiquitin-protein ligase RNF25 n=1 Tax=Erigeron canadensis TaxID=72917 RepID=UPI001CB88EED|nr:E3 ubiquitin-protein ligase RNF25 [Erigeron canadensis]
MAEEEDILIEIEAAESVYGDDCVVLSQYPPHLNLLIKPRTADVSSHQFVEAVIGIQATSKYPDEPPDIMIIDSKGLDEQRQKRLISNIHNKACELSSSSMLVALCEEAVEQLTSMNHPDGDCPLCLSSLVEEGASNSTLPFMKLMSCFHCFHCECIIRWWNWLQMHKEADRASSSGRTAHKNTEDGHGTCPVCRKVFHTKDIEHVLDLVGSYSQLNLEDSEILESDVLLHSNSENTRRQKFEAILKLQQENNGLIEPKKTEVLMPGMYLPCPVVTPTTALDKDTTTTTGVDQDTSNGLQTTESKADRGSSSISRNSRPKSKYRGRNSRTTTTGSEKDNATTAGLDKDTVNGEQTTEPKGDRESSSNLRNSGPRSKYRGRNSRTTTTGSDKDNATTARLDKDTAITASLDENFVNGEQTSEPKGDRASSSNLRNSGPRSKYRGRNSRTTTTGSDKDNATTAGLDKDTAITASLDKDVVNGEQTTESKGDRASSSNPRNSGPRSKYRERNSTTQVNRQWIIRETGNAQ